jgi:hypothetical protein
MDQTTLPTWISAASIAISATTGLINLAVTAGLALMVHNHSRRVSETQALQRCTAQWQDINKLLLENPALQRLVDPVTFGHVDDDEVRRYNFLFHVMGTVEELFQSRARGLVSAKLADPVLEGQLRFLAGSRDIVEQLVALDRGYDPAFKAFLSQGMARQADHQPLGSGYTIG